MLTVCVVVAIKYLVPLREKRPIIIGLYVVASIQSVLTIIDAGIEMAHPGMTIDN